MIELTASLSAARTLDVACGTGFLTRHLRGFVVAIDQSPAMVAIARSRLPDGLAIVAGVGSEQWQERILNDGSRHRSTSDISPASSWPKSSKARCCSRGLGSSLPGRQTSVATETRLLPWAVTVTAGVRPWWSKTGIDS